MAVERVEQPALQQVQDLERGVAGGRDEVVSRRMEGEAVHRRTMNWNITHTNTPVSSKHHIIMNYTSVALMTIT